LDSALAITAEFERISHVPSAIFSDIERMFFVMRALWRSIGYKHFNHTHPIEDRAVSVVAVKWISHADIRQHKTLPIVAGFPSHAS
jgi:hypothetical protein